MKRAQPAWARARSSWLGVGTGSSRGLGLSLSSRATLLCVVMIPLVCLWGTGRQMVGLWKRRKGYIPYPFEELSDGADPLGVGRQGCGVSALESEDLLNVLSGPWVLAHMLRSVPAGRLEALESTVRIS